MKCKKFKILMLILCFCVSCLSLKELDPTPTPTPTPPTPTPTPPDPTPDPIPFAPMDTVGKIITNIYICPEDGGHCIGQGFIGNEDSSSVDLIKLTDLSWMHVSDFQSSDSEHNPYPVAEPDDHQFGVYIYDYNNKLISSKTLLNWASYVNETNSNFVDWVDAGLITTEQFAQFELNKQYSLVIGFLYKKQKRMVLIPMMRVSEYKRSL